MLHRILSGHHYGENPNYGGENIMSLYEARKVHQQGRKEESLFSKTYPDLIVIFLLIEAYQLLSTAPSISILVWHDERQRRLRTRLPIDFKMNISRRPFIESWCPDSGKKRQERLLNSACAGP